MLTRHWWKVTTIWSISLSRAIIGACSIVGALIISRWDYHWLYYLGGILYWLSLFLMFLVKFTPLGVEVNGARRWLNFGIDALQFQPAEIAKIAAITFIPCLIMKMGKKIATRKGFWKLMFYGGALAAAALFFTDNLSTAIIIGGITGFMIFIAHPNQKMFLKIMGVLAVVLIVGRIILQMTLGGIQIDMNEVENFRLKRVLVWLNPEQYSSAGGYQIMQALYAIGSGGFFGKGLGNSVQKLGPVPEAQNDMIFFHCLRGIRSVRRTDCHCPLWISFISSVLYCTKCEGFLRLSYG
nr:FtsW/RodA/SpoVE family cell cycle protein [Blautia argi]